jgi:hypothetical protein
MHLWHDPVSSKDLLEGCVVFAMALTFVIVGSGQWALCKNQAPVERITIQRSKATRRRI